MLHEIINRKESDAELYIEMTHKCECRIKEKRINGALLYAYFFTNINILSKLYIRNNLHT